MNWIRSFLLRTIFYSVFITTFVHPFAGGAELDCDINLPPLQTRLANRAFPSLFMAWFHIQNLPLTITPDQRIPYHDLVWSAEYGYQYFSESNRLIDPENNFYWEKLKTRQMIDENPNLIFIVTLPVALIHPDAYLHQKIIQRNDFPWLRDADGKRVPDGYGEYWVDYRQPIAHQMFAEQAKALKDCGYDGIFIDLWQEHHDPVYRQGQVDTLKAIRQAVGDDFLILINANDEINPSSAPYVNGLMMETFRALSDNYSHRGMMALEDTLLWAAENLQPPVITCLEGEGIGAESPMSPANLQGMRLITTLALTHSNGYSLYTMGVQWDEPHTHDADYEGPHYSHERGDPVADVHANDHENLRHIHHHEHYWYDFYDAPLGQPVGELAERYQTPKGVEIDGLFIREFTNGWAVYNRSGRDRLIKLPEKVRGFSSGVRDKLWHTLADLDGEIYLKGKTPLQSDIKGDLNSDGVVNILDLVAITSAFGKDEPDLNADGVVNVLDLILVAQEFE